MLYPVYLAMNSTAKLPRRSVNGIMAHFSHGLFADIFKTQTHFRFAGRLVKSAL